MSLAVRIVSLLLTLTIFLLAALHVAYLVAAFDLRDQARARFNYQSPSEARGLRYQNWQDDVEQDAEQVGD